MGTSGTSFDTATSRSVSTVGSLLELCVSVSDISFGLQVSQMPKGDEKGLAANLRINYPEPMGKVERPSAEKKIVFSL